MYTGEGDRPNLLTWLITLNGANLSRDLAQRCVIIRIKRPIYSGDWEEQTRAYIDRNRPAILGDLLALLRSQRKPPAKYTRWGLWERDVLSRLPDPHEAQAVILERQAEADVDEEEAGIIEDAFRAAAVT
jgi:hypothetical protein